VRVRGVAIVLLGIAPACSLLVGENLSGGGASDSDGGIDVASPETHADAGDGTDDVADATSDTSTELDAGDPCHVEGLVTRLCDSFDGATWKAAWSPNRSGDSAVLAVIEDDDAGSRFLSATVAGQDSGRSEAFLAAGLPFTTRFFVRFRFRVEAIPSSNRQLATIEFVDGSNDGTLAVHLRSDGDLMITEAAEPPDGGPDYFESHRVSELDPGVWRSIAIDVDVAAHTIRVSLDGHEVVPAPAFRWTHDLPGSRVKVGIGPRYSPSPSGGLTAHYDDVVLASD